MRYPGEEERGGGGSKNEEHGVHKGSGAGPRPAKCKMVGPTVSKAFAVMRLLKVRPTSQMRARPVVRLMVWKRTLSCGGGQNGARG